ncbi:MAG: hypothetical protein WC665_07545 [Sulfurimonas sp.]|jgi:hypothetical protein
MSIVYEENCATFISIIYEDEVVAFRDFLQNIAPNEVVCDFSECDDIHFAILQLLMAYQKNYGCRYEFSDDIKLFEKVLKGFDVKEENCG